MQGPFIVFPSHSTRYICNKIGLTNVHSVFNKVVNLWARDFLSVSRIIFDRLCGLVVRVPGYRSGGRGFDSRTLKQKVVGLE
jgi:hypothetical protein